ncbi:pyruvate formate-lyase 1-activating enzyme [Anaerotignum neopropionicum]|uniref:Pyruvate formate-lyase 1-activating enzyme n=1 Tax=Anaerotignum neopropionicum TaxID=36847 RepID=A0A136WG19_9FIRM|nr:anaerobic ribonucleoside-triphosphate reductase activating protein [Anaerotignum neopropionicum]KXL53454.1 pyruvate formate-lyase 1-activating enzyme [Anaerotignum neopropionicum]
MLIGGLQKLSLLDYPDRTCCTIFTIGCNFRCPFCHNATIIQDKYEGPKILEKEILLFLEKRKNLLDGVCITGGEPLLQKGLEAFIGEIKALGFAVKLDTNGSFPERLQELIHNKLVDYVAMDIKNAPDKYGQTIGVKNYDISPIKQSISILLSNVVPYEFRTTVVRELHTDEDMFALAQWIKGTQNYYIQNFVNSNDVLARGMSSYSKDELQALLDLIHPLIPTARLRGV